MPLDVFYEVRTLPSSTHLLAQSLNRFMYTDRVLHASLGFAPDFSCVQAFSIDAYDEERSQFLASGTQEHRHAQSTPRPQRRTIHRIDIRTRLQCLLFSSLAALDQWFTPPYY